MKMREMLSPPSTTDLNQDRHKRTRAKSPTVAKNKQTYLQNLEKKLDELLTVSTNDKKNMTNAFGKSNMTELTANGKAIANFDSYQGGKRQKKVALCKVYSALKTCKKGDSCPFAHGHKQLDVEYKPVEWVRIFKQSSSHQSLRGGITTAHGQRPMTGMTGLTTSYGKRPTTGMSSTKSNFNKEYEYDFMRQQSPSPTSYMPGTQEDRDSQVNKVVNTKGRTLLIEATVINDLQTVKTLLKKGASATQRDWLGNDSIFYAIKNSNPVLLETLIKYSADEVNLDEQFTISKFSYLILAAKMSSSRMLEILLKYGAKPSISDRYNRTALFYCVEKNFKAGVELLLSYSIDVNPVDTYGKTALDYAYEKNLFDILDILIRAGGSSAETGKNKLLLLVCSQFNLQDSVHELLKRGMLPTEADENGNNMLMIAYESGHLELLEVVIIEYSLRTALNQKNKRGDNLIMRSVKDHNDTFTKFLLHNSNVDLNSRDETGKTLLMYAAESGDYETVEFLVNRGVSVDSTDKYGRNALIFACKNNHVLTVEVLLKCTLNTLWKDYLGKSAKQYTTDPLIKGLLKHYMIEKNQLSESLIKEVEDSKPQLKNIK